MLIARKCRKKNKSVDKWAYRMKCMAIGKRYIARVLPLLILAAVLIIVTMTFTLKGKRLRRYIYICK